MSKRLFAFAGLFLLLSCAGASHCAIRYSIHDLGWPLGGEFSEANGISNQGRIVGRASTPDGHYCAVVWEPDGATISLHSSTDWFSSAALAVADVIVGFAQDNTLERHAIVWVTSGYPDSCPIGVYDLGPGIAWDVNSHSQVVGWTQTVYDSRAFLWDPLNGITDLGTLGGINSAARGINNVGEVVGQSSLTPGSLWPNHGFVWTSSSGMVDLGAMPGHQISIANSINDAGQIAGRSFNMPVTWDRSGVIKSLALPAWPNIYGTAIDINNCGQVLGSIGNRLGVIWNPDGAMVSTGGSSQDSIGFAPRAINDSGCVVGYDLDAEPRRHAILARPRIFAVFDQPVSKSNFVFGHRGAPIKFRILDTDDQQIREKRLVVSLEVSGQGPDGPVVYSFSTEEDTVRFEPGAGRYAVIFSGRDCPLIEGPVTLTVKDGGFAIGAITVSASKP